MIRWVLACSLVVWLVGCKDDDEGTGATGDTGAAGDAAAGDTTADDTTASDTSMGETGDDVSAPDPVERGTYLVNHVAACIDCHTPRDETGQLMLDTMLLAGDPGFADIVPEEDGVGLVPTPNLTPHATGLAEWSDDEIKNAFLNGIDRDDNPLFPIMPYWVFHNITDDDADAIVAYLRSIPAVDNEIPDREPLPFPFEQAAQPVPESAIPRTTLEATDEGYEAAQRGRYLAGNVGICIDCHTQENPAGPIPVMTDQLLAGAREFPAADFGLPSPPFPEIIYSANITPHETGIAGWTAQQVADVLLQGIDDDGEGICPPMPVGPNQAFGGLTEDDALAIGMYLTTIPGVDNEIPGDCVPPPPPE